MTITLTNLLQCDYVIIKNSGESFRNEMKSAEGVSSAATLKKEVPGRGGRAGTASLSGKRMEE